jgi:thiamine kinase-like enzyme
VPASAEAVSAPWGESGPSLAFAADVAAADREEIAALLGNWDVSLFPGPEVAISVLVGGANNRNYVVTCEGAKYALRIANAQNERFAVDRDSAIQAQRDAAAGGLAPRVYAAKLPDGHVLSGFVEGKTLLGAEELRDREVLEAVGRSLRQLHALPSSIRAFSPFDDIRLWTRLAREDGTELPPDLDQLLATVGRIEAAVIAAGLPAVFCHNDTVPQNFILAGSDLRVVDWDYAGRGWACFELASFSATADLDDDLQEVLLRSYDAETNDCQRATIQLLRFVAAMREASWALMAAPILKGTTTPDDDLFYENYLRDYLQLSRERAARPDFEQLMAQAAADQGPRSW